MTGDPLFDCLLLAVGFTAFLCFGVLLKISAPYGKHDRDGWGPAVNARAGWCVMELSCFVSFVWFYWQGAGAFQPLALLFATLFTVHYFHRSFIYPWAQNMRPGTQIKLVVVTFGILFNIVNGYLNGTFLGQYAVHLYNINWIGDPRFFAGLLLFFCGLVLNKHSEWVLRNLRSPGKVPYGIPHGGGFRLVSNPHYLGEIIQWAGFALASWSPAAMMFVLFTLANLGPRALVTHQWYHQRFSDYPRERKALVPFVI